MWISWKQPTWQREYQVIRPCDKKGPGVFKAAKFSRTRSHSVWSAMGKREKSRQYQRRNRDKTVLCHIKDFDLYSE